jgi:succinyl-CoA synthetase alpha subunit
MSILVNENTRLLFFGMTGKFGRYHAARLNEAFPGMLLAGISPGKGGIEVDGVPVYETAKEACERHDNINTALILVPPKAVLSSALDSLQAGVKLVVIITEFVPVKDTITIVSTAREKGAIVIGPNTIGALSPGRGKAGIMPTEIYSRGHIGVVSRSGTLTHEVSSGLTFAGFGQSTCIGIGGDPVIGVDHKQALEMFLQDEDTLAVVLVGEIGGSGEEAAARYMQEVGYSKPVFAVIAGAQAPENTKMGHAGAIVSGKTGTAQSKIQALTAAGVVVAPTMGILLEKVAQLDVAMGGMLKTCKPIGEECTV